MRTAGVAMSDEVYEMMFVQRLMAAAEASVAVPSDHSGWEQVEQTFQTMLDERVRPSVPVHTLRVASYARLGRLEEAEAAFHSLRAATVQQAENVADTDALTMAPRTVKELMVEQLRSTAALWDAHKKQEAEGVVTAAEKHRTAWERLLSTRRQAAMKLVASLRDNQATTHALKFSAAVKEHVRLGRVEAAEAAMEVMRVAALKPLPDAFEVLVTAHGRMHDWARMEATMKVRMCDKEC
jgi:hypothetical protein